MWVPVWVRDLEITGVAMLVMGFRYFIICQWVTNRYGNRPTELIKSEAFFWYQMWDVTLKWTTVSAGFIEVNVGGWSDRFYEYGI